jgi:putative ABC transport system permease protein
LHRAMEVEPGDEVVFMGQNFVVDKTHDERGSKDDITLWMNLGQCQELLDLDGQINEIKALECNCATVDRLGEIRAELLKILPDTQIIETGSSALARAEARNQAKATAGSQIAAKKRERDQLRVERARFSSLLLPLVALFAMAWVGLLAFTNVRERITEIGILRALGVRGNTVLLAFLGRAVMAGLLGALVGAGLFAILYPLFRDSRFHGFSLADLVDGKTWLLAVVLAPLLAAMAAWLPSLLAAQKDPATILRHD